MESSPLRLSVVHAALHGLMSALATLQATPAERASIARSIYVTVMLDLVNYYPGNFDPVKLSMQGLIDQLTAMLACESVEAMTAWCRAESQKSTFEFVEAKVAG